MRKKKICACNKKNGFKPGHSNRHYLEADKAEEAEADASQCLPPVTSAGPDSPPSPPHTRGYTRSEKERKHKGQEYFIAHKENVEVLFNTAFRQHLKQSPNCNGDLSLKQEKKLNEEPYQALGLWYVNHVSMRVKHKNFTEK